jgi:hypothetical protein
MRKALVSTFLVLFFSICAVTELRASPDSDRDEPFDMSKLDLARFPGHQSDVSYSSVQREERLISG